MNQVQSYANMVHESPLRTDIHEIARLAIQPSSRQKIVGKRPKDAK